MVANGSERYQTLPNGSGSVGSVKDMEAGMGGDVIFVGTRAFKH